MTTQTFNIGFGDVAVRSSTHDGRRWIDAEDFEKFLARLEQEQSMDFEAQTLAGRYLQDAVVACQRLQFKRDELAAELAELKQHA